MNELPLYHPADHIQQTSPEARHGDEWLEIPYRIEVESGCRYMNSRVLFSANDLPPGLDGRMDLSPYQKRVAILNSKAPTFTLFQPWYPSFYLLMCPLLAIAFGVFAVRSSAVNSTIAVNILLACIIMSSSILWIFQFRISNYRFEKHMTALLAVFNHADQSIGIEWFLRVDDRINKGLFNCFNVRVFTPPYVTVCIRTKQPTASSTDALPPLYHDVFGAPPPAFTAIPISPPSPLPPPHHVASNLDTPSRPPSALLPESSSPDASLLRHVETDAGSVWRVPHASGPHAPLPRLGIKVKMLKACMRGTRVEPMPASHGAAGSSSVAVAATATADSVPHAGGGGAPSSGGLFARWFGARGAGAGGHVQLQGPEVEMGPGNERGSGVAPAYTAVEVVHADNDHTREPPPGYEEHGVGGGR